MASSNPEIFFAKTANCFLESDWFPATQHKTTRVRLRSEKIKKNMVGIDEPGRVEERESGSGEGVKGEASP